MSFRHCQFCSQLHSPVKGRVPSETCDRCWLEINAALMLDMEREKAAPMIHEPSADSYFFVPEVHTVQ